MSDWEILRQQVAICGIIANPGDVPVSSAEVVATQAGKASSSFCFTSRADGSYFFTDLPEGTYSVKANAGGQSAAGKAVVASDADGTVRIVRLNLALKT